MFDAAPSANKKDLVEAALIANNQCPTCYGALPEVERLREQLAEWESSNVAQVELRGLVESHMDTARGQWECVAKVERLRAALMRYGKHLEACRFFKDLDEGACDCGLIESCQT